MRTSVVIPTLNAGPGFRALLECLRAQRPAGPDEIVVVDSGSSDQTRELAREFGARVVEWDRPYNHGLTRDAGIAAAGGDICFLTVQDARPASTDWLARVAAHFDDPSVAGVSTRQIPPPDGPLELKIKAALDAQAGLAAIRVSLADHPGYAQYSPARRLELYRFDNVCSALRRSVWERIPMGECRYAEDLLWARRALEAGHALVRDPSAPVIHAHRRSFWYEFRRALLDAWVLDECFGYRYSYWEKLDRARALARGGASVGTESAGPSGARLEALKTYSAHAIARGMYSGYCALARPLGIGGRVLARLTEGI